MKEKIGSLLEEVTAFNTDNLDQLEAFRIKYLSKKGIIPGLFTEFRNVAPEDRKEMGQLLNGLKTAILGRRSLRLKRVLPAIC